MKRIPLVATLIVALAVATMIGLGFWQLWRAGEKETLLAVYHANAERPVLDLDPYVNGSGPSPLDMSYRRVLITCWPNPAAYERRGGRSRDGRPGWRYLLACQPSPEGARQGWSSLVMVDHGWSASPTVSPSAFRGGVVAGFTGHVSHSGPIVLTSSSARPPLAPSAPPSLDTIPNNHRLYAFQWFAFALIALVIYALALRRRWRPSA